MSRGVHTCVWRNTASVTAAACALVVDLLPGSGARAGKLDDVREATGGDGGGAEGEDDGDGGDSGDDGAVEALADAASEAFADALLAAAASRGQEVRFRRYPYSDGARGWIVDLEESAPRPPVAPTDSPPGAVVLSESVEPAPGPSLASTSFRMSLDYSYDWDGLHRPGVSAALDSSAGLGLRVDFTAYLEPREGRSPDFLGIGAADAMLRVADSDRFAPYVGIGWRYLVDGGAFRNGFNAILAADVFPVKPLVISAIAEGGNLGDAAFFRFRGTLGASVQRLELFVGYEAVIVRGGGDPVVFHGPVAGARAWF